MPSARDSMASKCDISTSNRSSSSVKGISFGLFASMLLVGGGCASPGVAWGPVRHGLQARIALEKNQFTVGERVAVTFQVRNACSDAIALPRRMEMLYSNTHLSFEGEPATGLIGSSEYPQSPEDFVILKPGEVYKFPHHRESMELHVHASRAGTYTFWSSPAFYGPNLTPGGERVAGVDAWTGLLESNRVCFTVIESGDGSSRRDAVNATNALVWKATRRVFPLEPGVAIQPPVISPDRRRCAQLGVQIQSNDIVRDGPCWAVVDDKRFGPYDRIEGILFSPDSKRVAIRASRNKEHFAVIDGVEGPGHESTIWVEVIFSPDSKHYAYCGNKDGRETIIRDGHPIATHRSVSSIAFTPDSKHLVYIARDDRSVAVYLGRKKLGEYEAVNDWSMRISPDSSRLAYPYRRDGQWYVAFGDKHFGPFEADTIQEMHISSGGRDICFSARQDGKWYFFTASERHGPYDDWSMASFSPDGKRLAYCGRLRGRTTVYLDGKPLGTFDSTWDLTFSPDSRHFAFLARDGKEYFLCVDGNTTPAGFGTVGLAYSPDSRRLAAGVSEGYKRRVVEGSEKGKLYDEIKSICFSPDSKHLAYWARLGEDWHLVVDGGEVLRFRGKPLEAPVFDDQGRLCGATVEFPENIPVREMWCEGLRLVLWELESTASRSPVEMSGGPGSGDTGTSHARDDTIVAITGKRTRLSIRATTLHVVPDHLSVWEATASPDASRLVYKARRRGDGGFIVVMDGKAGPEYREILVPPRFSPDGKRVFYIAKDGAGQRAVVDGVVGESFESVQNPAFSPDGHRLAYVGLRGKKQVLVVDGRPSAEHEYGGLEVVRPVFSPDGNRLAYYRHGGGKWLAVADGREGPPFDAILPSGPVFSPDGRRVAYAAYLQGKGMCVVLDGVEQEWFEGIARDYPPVFSPDSKHLTYVAQSGANMMVVREGKKGTEYRWVGCPVFSPDGKRLCYGAWGEGRKEDYWAVIVDGQERSISKSEVRNPVFSPDSKRLAWVAVRSLVTRMPKGGKETGLGESVVVDGDRGKEYDKVQALTFCPAGRRVAYIAVWGTERFVVVDGQEQEKFASVGGPLFSPDGQHVAYSAGDAKGRGFLVVDDAKYPIDCLGIVFTSPTTLRVLGSTDGQRRFVCLDVQLTAPTGQKEASGSRK